MLKKDYLVGKYAEIHNVTKRDATLAVDEFISLMKGAVTSEGIDIYGFGKFVIEDVPERTRKYTMGEKKGEEYTTPASKKIKFKVAKAIKDAVNA